MSSQIMSDNTSVVFKLAKETKPSMCRICLVENVRMHVVADKSLQELYEKLTDIPFAAKDSRPMLACFICYAKLKQCCQFQRQCLQAEELFAQMLNEDYELYPAMYRSQLQWCGRFITTPIVNISIVDDYRVEKDAIKVEVPAVSETQCEVELIQLKQDPLSDELDSQHDSNQELEDFPLEQYELNSEDDLPLMVIKFEEEEEQPAKQTTSTSIAKKPELGIRKAKQEDITPAQHENNGLLDAESILTTENCTLLKSLKIEDPISIMNPTVNECIVEDSTATLNKQNIRQVTNHSVTAIDTIFRNNCNENDLMCNMWNHGGINDDDINKSQSLCIKEKPYKCDICLKSFICKCNLNAHVRLHTGERPYKCDICQKSFAKKQCLKSHVRTHSNDKRYKCNICQTSYALKRDLNAHVRVHTGGKPYKCEICQKRFDRLSFLNRHVRIHTGEKPYKCEICQKSFASKVYLNSHVRVHTGDERFKCDICQKRFITNQRLVEHARVHTGEKPYECKICQKSFASTSNLNQHVLIHTIEKSFKCQICQKSFTRKPSLNAHVLIHTDEKPYKCEICEKRFSSNKSLERHVLAHSGIKPYMCDICGKSFVRKISLNDHVRVKHTGEKPYKCEICHKTFLSKLNLQGHVHCTSLTCGILCKKRFACKTNLNVHVLTHTGVKPYKCDICSKSFTQLNCVKRHARTHTGKVLLGKVI